MIIHIYDEKESPLGMLQPNVIHDKVWNLKVFTEKEEIKLNISEDHGRLHISVDGQLIIEPCTANTVNISSKHF